ncbi:MAG TPA: hypothetical protein VN375_05510 [Vicinamibacteria bacterium]|jgi:hypothetical protein|nr:hypothetical protein [Vicinamibacteria bacterium]
MDAPKASPCGSSALPSPGSLCAPTLRPLATALLAAGLVLGLGAPAWAAGDPLNGLVEVITQNAQRWSAALMIVGGLGAGGSMVLGHHQSGDHARRFLFGSLFLLAAGAGVQMYSRMQSLLGGF